MAANGNGNGNGCRNGENKLGLKIGERTGTCVEDERSQYNLLVQPDETQFAIRTSFEAYVEADGRDHLMKWLGYIDPRLVIQLHHNLMRKLRKNEVEILGGPDGDENKICEAQLEISRDATGAGSFDELPEEEQKHCTFAPGWGLSFDTTRRNPLVHLLNVMLDPRRPQQNDLEKAILMVDIVDVLVLGNKILVHAGDDTNEVVVSGKPWHWTQDGKVFAGHGNLGNLCKQLREAKADFELAAFTMDPVELFDKLSEVQEEKKAVVIGKKTSVFKSIAARLMGKTDEAAVSAK